MDERSAAARYLEGAALLPPRLRGPAEGLARTDMARAEELRLRVGRPMTAVYPEGEAPVPGAEEAVTAEEVERVLEIATRASAHTAQAQIVNGFFTVAGGHRIGVCGSAVMEGGQMRSVRHISSLAIRVARAVPGAAARVLDKLWEGGMFQSTLLVSPPGVGKTTLLRDLIRAISDGDGCPPLRVGAADERGELAALRGGAPQFDIGARTDVMDGSPKEKALLMLLRGMNPQVLAADAITAPAACAALELAANCGVALLCSAHGAGMEDLERRPLYRDLLARKIFRRLVVIRRTGEGRADRVSRLC